MRYTSLIIFAIIFIGFKQICSAQKINHRFSFDINGTEIRNGSKWNSNGLSGSSLTYGLQYNVLGFLSIGADLGLLSKSFNQISNPKDSLYKNVDLISKFSGIRTQIVIIGEHNKTQTELFQGFVEGGFYYDYFYRQKVENSNNSQIQGLSNIYYNYSYGLSLLIGAYWYSFKKNKDSRFRFGIYLGPEMTFDMIKLNEWKSNYNLKLLSWKFGLRVNLKSKNKNAT